MAKARKARPLMQRGKRLARYKFLQLMRAPGGPSFVALGFAIGIFVEMFTLPTYGLAFFLIFPLVYFFRASFAGALVGFVVGKVIYLPMAVLNKMVGGWVLPPHIRINIPLIPDFINRTLLINLKLIVGGIIVGLVLGVVFYFPVRMMIRYFANKRNEKRKQKRQASSIDAIPE